MKTLEPKRAENKAEKATVNRSAEDATVSAPSVQIDLSKVKIEPLFADDVDFETFSVNFRSFLDFGTASQASILTTLKSDLLNVSKSTTFARDPTKPDETI